jgi:hypothetical protein
MRAIIRARRASSRCATASTPARPVPSLGRRRACGEIWVSGVVEPEPCLRGYAMLITTDEATIRIISDLTTDYLEQGLAARARLAPIGV